MRKREPETVAKTALITGISGQDGAYLARALLARGYRVVGAFRRTSGISVGRLEELGISDEVELVDMELLEASNLRHVLNKLKPDEIYNLAAQSFVGLSFEQPIYTSDIDALGVLRLLEATVVAVDPKLYRPAEVDVLIGDARKAKVDLGWEAKTSLEGLIQMMVQADYDRVKTGIIRC
jgi:GDPmannose 4,6-dehydratase